ncbi:MAG: lipid II flippase MurJ, partial [Desulfobacterales bacterium]
TIPAMVGLIVLREPIVALLFKRGAFDEKTTRLTAYALLYYSVGLWAFSAVRIVVSTFYALQDTKTPVRIGVISVCANLIFGIVLMGPLKHGGLALATSLASMLNLGLLVRALRIKLGMLGMKAIIASANKTILCSAFMGGAVWMTSLFIIPSAEGNLSGLFLGLAGSIAIGFISYGLFSLLFKSRELEKVLAIARKGVGKA